MVAYQNEIVETSSKEDNLAQGSARTGANDKVKREAETFGEQFLFHFFPLLLRAKRQKILSRLIFRLIRSQ